MAEAPKTSNPAYVKHVKGTATRVVKGKPKAQRYYVVRSEPRKVKRVRRIVKRTTCCEATQQMAMVPMAAPYMPPLPPCPRAVRAARW